jgi:hypothetical protein
MTNDTALTHSPLTILSDDEAMFRDAVAGFANDDVRPLVQQMERDAPTNTAAPAARSSWSRSG